jgi:hypothetical protein
MGLISRYGESVAEAPWKAAFRIAVRVLRTRVAFPHPSFCSPTCHTHLVSNMKVLSPHAHQRLWVPRMARVATMVVAGWRYCGPLEHAGVNSVDRMERDGQPLTCTGASLQCRGW